jgi:hypothetical protein
MTLRAWRSLLTVTCLGAASVLAAAPPVTVKDVKVTDKTSSVGKSKGNRYLSVQYTATVTDAVPKLMVVQVKASCKAGDKTVEAENGATGALDKVEKGTSKPGSVALFMTEGLPASAKSCDLDFKYGKFATRTGDPIASFCWDGSAVKEGHCK